MHEQNLGRGQDDALERTLTALYAQELPQAFQEHWPALIRQEARARQQKGQRPGTARQAWQAWRLIMPAFAAVLLAIGIWAISLPSAQQLTAADTGLATESASNSPMIAPMSVLSSPIEAEALGGGGIVEEESLLPAETTSPDAERKAFGIAALVAACVIAGGLLLDAKLHLKKDKGGTQP